MASQRQIPITVNQVKQCRWIYLEGKLGFEAAVPNTLQTDCGLRTAFPPEFNSVCACKASIQQEVPELHLDSVGNFVKSHPQRVHDFLECFWILLRKATSSCGRLDSELLVQRRSASSNRELKWCFFFVCMYWSHIICMVHCIHIFLYTRWIHRDRNAQYSLLSLGVEIAPSRNQEWNDGTGRHYLHWWRDPVQPRGWLSILSDPLFFMANIQVTNFNALLTVPAGVGHALHRESRFSTYWATSSLPLLRLGPVEFFQLARVELGLLHDLPCLLLNSWSWSVVFIAWSSQNISWWWALCSVCEGRHM